MNIQSFARTHAGAVRILCLAGARTQAIWQRLQSPIWGFLQAREHLLRTLLIHGFRSVLAPAKGPGPWLDQIKRRRRANVTIVAQAAKMAKAILAVTATAQGYQRSFKGIRPQTA